MTIRTSLAIAVTAAAALLLAGCGSNNSTNGTVIANGAGATVTQKADGSTTVDLGDGTAVSTGATPAAMPGGLPAYPNAQDVNSIDLAGATSGTAAHTVSFTTADASEQVLRFYEQAAGPAGLTDARREALGQTTRLMMRKGDEAVWVGVRTGDGATQVSVSSGPR